MDFTQSKATLDRLRPATAAIANAVIQEAHLHVEEFTTQGVVKTNTDVMIAVLTGTASAFHAACETYSRFLGKTIDPSAVMAAMVELNLANMKANRKEAI